MHHGALEKEEHHGDGEKDKKKEELRRTTGSRRREKAKEKIRKALVVLEWQEKGARQRGMRVNSAIHAGNGATSGPTAHREKSSTTWETMLPKDTEKKSANYSPSKKKLTAQLQ